jgi:hypothetical protein
MRITILLSFLVMSVTAAGAQAPAKPPAQAQPPPAQPRPAAAAPAQRRAPAAARAGLTITVADPKGAALEGVHLDLIGPTDRSADSDSGGRVNLPGLLAGTYRLRFSGEHVTAFEREVVLRAGQTAAVDVMLNPAPEPPPAPAQPPPPEPAPAPASAPVGPTGQPLTLSIEDQLEKEFIRGQPRRESLLSCSGNERATMIQLNEPMPERVYESADIVYYVLAGEGSVVLDSRTSRIATNGFISVPRGTVHSFERRGSRPLVLLAVLGGEPCERAR